MSVPALLLSMIFCTASSASPMVESTAVTEIPVEVVTTRNCSGLEALAPGFSFEFTQGDCRHDFPGSNALVRIYRHDGDGCHLTRVFRLSSCSRLVGANGVTGLVYVLSADRSWGAWLSHALVQLRPLDDNAVRVVVPQVIEIVPCIGSGWAAMVYRVPSATDKDYFDAHLVLAVVEILKDAELSVTVVNTSETLHPSGPVEGKIGRLSGSADLRDVPPTPWSGLLSWTSDCKELRYRQSESQEEMAFRCSTQGTVGQLLDRWLFGRPDWESAETDHSTAETHSSPGPVLSPARTVTGPDSFGGPSAIHEFLRKRRGAFHKCHSDLSTTSPGIHGRIKFRLTIHTNGQSEFSVIENETGSTELAECMASKIRSWRFPAASDRTLEFTHTVVFDSPVVPRDPK